MKSKLPPPVKLSTPRVCSEGKFSGGKSVPCGATVTHKVIDYFFVAAKGHRDLFVCDECGKRLAGFPNFMKVVRLKKGGKR